MIIVLNININLILIQRMKKKRVRGAHTLISREKLSWVTGNFGVKEATFSSMFIASFQSNSLSQPRVALHLQLQLQYTIRQLLLLYFISCIYSTSKIDS